MFSWWWKRKKSEPQMSIVNDGSVSAYPIRKTVLKNSESPEFDRNMLYQLEEALSTLLEDRDLRQLSARNLLRFDTNYRSHVQFSFNHSALSGLEEGLSEKASYNQLLCSVLQPNGYAREKAMELLMNHPSILTLKVMLVRSNDWVHPLSQKGQQLSFKLLKEGFPPEELLEIIPLMQALRGCYRNDLESFLDMLGWELYQRIGYAKIISALIVAPNEEMRFYAEFLAKQNVEIPVEEVSILLHSPNVNVQMVALKHFVPLLEDIEKKSIRLRMLPSRWSGVRKERLMQLIELSPNELQRELERALLDKSWLVRMIARFHLNQIIGGYDYAHFYSEKLHSDDQRVSVYALQGLHEISPDLAQEVIPSWLTSGTKAQQVIALYTADEATCRKLQFQILDILESESAQLRKAAGSAIQKLYDIEALQNLLDRTNIPSSRTYLIRAIVKYPLWETFSYVLHNLRDRQESVASIAEGALNALHVQLMSTYTSPSVAQLGAIKEELKSSQSRIDIKLFESVKFHLSKL